MARSALALALALLWCISLVAAQTIRVYSDKHCKHRIRDYECQKTQHCTNIPKAARSYKTIVSENGCGGTFYTSFLLAHGKNTCDEQNQVASGPPTCNTYYGCQPTLNYQGPPGVRETANSLRCLETQGIPRNDTAAFPVKDGADDIDIVKEDDQYADDDGDE